jgi:alkylmercury lyase
MTESTQTNRIVDEGHTLLAAQGDPEILRRLIPASIRLLAEGAPVSPAQIADASGVPVDQAEAALRGIEDIEWTADGRVEGFGLTRRPTPHRFRIGETDLYTWCAMDTLIFAALVDRPAQIQSPDGATGEPLRLETDGQRIIAADPPSIAVSWFFDAAATGSGPLCASSDISSLRARARPSGRRSTRRVAS